MNKQFSAACERNREPIAAVLHDIFKPAASDETSSPLRVLEIGSGTGQHAVFFAARFPHVIWQTSDLVHNHPSILAWQQQEQLPNVLPPLTLDMSEPDWWQTLPAQYDAVFTANTCHIMAWPEVQNLFAGVGRLLAPGGTFCIYGPFNYNGLFTSASNAAFDASLRQQAGHMGIRDFSALAALAAAQQLELREDHPMPANNRLLEWRRI
ncbi:DUF938 domain-containing protein [Paraherbaspirillum soli]|uniref:DUF938 domain-containing protein n=1 Tax=Paraherbaspirillum soli TaxID=631222 RepID=A0ABW0M754_9BURK